MKIISRHREVISREASLIQGFMQLLMKPSNTGNTWTKEEQTLLKSHLKHLSGYIPVLMIFLLPGGSLLLPFLAELLNRRKAKREKQ
ncbi:MAG: hypothetical protein HZA14_00990 [Nitrospirae bacterium]|nr:hypothetical protein [Nitrospirota bacterium]